MIELETFGDRPHGCWQVLFQTMQRQEMATTKRRSRTTNNRFDQSNTNKKYTMLNFKNGSFIDISMSYSGLKDVVRRSSSMRNDKMKIPR